MSDIKTKKCTGCDIDKPLDDFDNQKNGKYGKRSKCKLCRKRYRDVNKEERKKYDKKRYEENRDEKLDYQKEYYKDNKEDILEYQENYREDNKEKILNRDKEYREENRSKLRKGYKKFYQNNKEDILEKQKVWRDNNKDIKSERDRIYRENNKEKIREQKRKYFQENKDRINEKYKQRKKDDLNFRIKCNLRTRIWGVLQGNNKSDTTRELLGCTIKIFLKHLEEQFTSRMSWDNYGDVWEIDHIIPCSHFNFESELHQRVCFHYTNMQPLLISDNRSKKHTLPKRFGGELTESNIIREYKKQNNINTVKEII